VKKDKIVSKRIEQLAETLAILIRPDITPKQLFEAVRRRHSEVSRKEIARAAYYVLIRNAGDKNKTDLLRELAVASRPSINEGG
jgi:hypothetical protein